MPAETPSDDLEVDVEAVIAACDGNLRTAIRVLLIANRFLEAEVERLERAVSPGFVRGKVRRPSASLTGGPSRVQS